MKARASSTGVCAARWKLAVSASSSPPVSVSRGADEDRDLGQPGELARRGSGARRRRARTRPRRLGGLHEQRLQHAGLAHGLRHPLAARRWSKCARGLKPSRTRIALSATMRASLAVGGVVWTSVIRSSRTLGAPRCAGPIPTPPHAEGVPPSGWVGPAHRSTAPAPRSCARSRTGPEAASVVAAAATEPLSQPHAVVRVRAGGRRARCVAGGAGRRSGRRRWWRGLRARRARWPAPAPAARRRRGRGRRGRRR